MAAPQPAPGPFLWGVSTSGYQHEGGYNGPGQPRNNWAAWEENGRAEPTGRSVDFWNHFEEDIDRAASLGLNSFRLGIEWTRLQPEPRYSPSNEPLFDPKVLARYADILLAARRRRLEPLLTLHHFTHPAWLGPDFWLEPTAPDRFVAFAQTAMILLNRALADRGEAPLHWFVTINEPNMLALSTYLTGTFPSGPKRGIAPLIQAAQGLILAHIRTYRSLHQTYAREGWPTPMISFNNYASDLYWMDKLITDLVAAPGLGVHRGDLAWWLVGRAHRFDERFNAAHLPLSKTLPYWMGALIKHTLLAIGHRLLETGQLERFADAVYAEDAGLPLDYLAFDYYDPFVGNLFRLPRWDELFHPGLSLRARLLQSITSKTWDWPALPQGLSFFVRIYEEDYPGKPILITENGMARLRRSTWQRSWRKDQLRRADYLDRHLAEVTKLRRQGSALSGYFHWSLTDNYEWGSFAPKFGLFEVDLNHPDLPRQAVDSAGLNAAETYRRWIASS